MSKINIPSQDRSKESKERILEVALELFANYGYDKVSTREIATQASVNISAIKYYFGDKLSLYKTVYQHYMMPPVEEGQVLMGSVTLEEELEKIFSVLIVAFRRKEFHLCRKLHMREQLDPMGLWKNDIENGIRPKHYEILELIKKEIPNISHDDASRLLFSMISLSFGVFVNIDVINVIEPHLINNEENLKIWKQQLIDYARAMINLEKNKK